MTDSLPIVDALIGQPRTRYLMPRIHAPKLFMGAASVGPQVVMQAYVVLVAAER